MKVEADAAALLWAHNENAFLKCEPAGVPGSEVRGPVEEPNPPPGLSAGTCTTKGGPLNYTFICPAM